MSLRYELMVLGTAVTRKVRAVVGSGGRDPDIEQAWLRVVLCIVSLAYVGWLVASRGALTPGLALCLVAGAGDALVGIGMIWRLRHSEAHRVPLRYLGIVSDNLALTIGMAGAGEGGVAMIGVFLWVTVGNGFRSGPRYLLASYWLSLLGFSSLLLFSEFWIAHRGVGTGLLLALAIVPLYVLVLLVRLTAQKDAAEQLSNAKSRFVANVSHELRTPLTGVFAVYDLLRSRRMTPDDRELVGMLGNAVKTLKTSVDAVLQMSKLEAGAERADPRPFNLLYFIQQLSAMVRPQSTVKGLSWSLHVDPQLSTTVVGDPVHLSHVLGNLLNNAFKFTATGGVSLRATSLEDDRVRFEVVDSGIGIPLDQQEHLFERFVQVDSSATRKFGGTGLGTSIARDLTELMGGRIGVISAPGKGSTFWIELRLPAPASAVQPVEWGSTREVLVVGDAGPALDETVVSLRALGLEPDVVTSSAGKERTFDAQRHFAALLVMSAGDAAAFSEAVLRDRAGIAAPWIVMAPSYSSMQRASLVAGGASALLPEDASVAQLRDTLSALLHRLELPATADAPSLPDSGVVRSLRILLADDNMSNQLLLSRILEDAGHKVVTAERGDRAFDLMSAGNLDLAIIDLNMPDMCGPDVVKLYRAGSIGGAKLPVIILSADATPAAKQESIEAGADEFVTKPVTSAMLLATIGRVMAGTAVRGETLALVPRPEKVPSSKSPVLVDVDRIQALRRIARDDASFLDQYVMAAFSEMEKAISDLRAAAHSSNARAARDALHILEGTGASIGATALVGNCRTMREHLSAGRDGDRAGVLAELSTTYALTKSTVQASLHESRARLTLRTRAAR